MNCTNVKISLLSFLFVCWCFLLTGQNVQDTVAGIPVNYDESKTGSYTLPDPLVFPDGKKVKNARQWIKKRQPQVVSLFEKFQYGKVPEVTDKMDVHIFAPTTPIPAPSSDAIDLGVCSNVLIRGCYMSVNDDAIALKGGKGPWADEDSNNGLDKNILIENNSFGFCHSALTCGSESIHNRNILMRNCKVEDIARLIHLKMRPDTPQKYEYITIENINGSGRNCIYIKPWTQFFDLKGRETPPVSVAENILFRNITMEVKRFTDIGITEHDKLKNFTFENLDIKAEDIKFDASVFEGLKLKM